MGEQVETGQKRNPALFKAPRQKRQWGQHPRIRQELPPAPIPGEPGQQLGGEQEAEAENQGNREKTKRGHLHLQRKRRPIPFRSVPEANPRRRRAEEGPPPHIYRRTQADGQATLLNGD